MMTRRLLAAALAVGLLLAGCARGGPEGGAVMKPLPDELRGHVVVLASEIGTRGLHKPEAYAAAATYIEGQLQQFGYGTARQTYSVEGMNCVNIEAELRGAKTPEKILVIGAHYDTVPSTAGANDNGSGVAALLAMARALRHTQPGITLRFVAFANEEPPYFQTPRMGSMVYARACRERGEKIVGMLSLETIGFYSDAPNSQKYPSPYESMYPSTGNFIGMVGNVESKAFLEQVVTGFRAHSPFPVEAAAVPDMAPGVGWSDHWSFWQHGYPAVMVTDTAPFRYPHYHLSTDTPDRLDYRRMAQVVEALTRAIGDLARP